MNVRFVLLSSDTLIKYSTASLSKTAYSQLRNHLSKNITSSFLIKQNNQLQKRHIHISLIKFTENQKAQQSNPKILSSSLVESDGKHHQNQVSTHLSPGKRAKQAVKDTGYGLVIAVGGLILVAIFYYLFTELFSRETPSGIYDESSKMCLDNFEVKEALGAPIKVTAESGGRRIFQIKHKYYVEDGHLFLIINYYLEGPKNKGVVYCKVKKNESTGKFEYESIIVKLDYAHRGQKKIVVQHKDSPITGSAPIGGSSRLF